MDTEFRHALNKRNERLFNDGVRQGRAQQYSGHPINKILARQAKILPTAKKRLALYLEGMILGYNGMV